MKIQMNPKKESDMCGTNVKTRNMHVIHLLGKKTGITAGKLVARTIDNRVVRSRNQGSLYTE